MKTIAQQLNVKEFPFEIRDSNGNQIYFENSSGFWTKREYDLNGYEIHYEDSKGYWSKNEYNSQGNQIYYEDSNGVWSKYEYDSDDNQIYSEYSNGYIVDDRPKPIPEYTMEELVAKLGEFKIKK